MTDYAQTNAAWANKKLGFSTWETIGNAGCYVTAIANVCKFLGKDTDPARMNEQLKTANLFAGPGRDLIARDDAIQRIYADIKYIETKNWPINKIAPLNYFDIRHSKTIEIIVKIDYSATKPGIQPHFCRVIGLTGDRRDVIIVDSYDGQRKTLGSISRLGGKLPMHLVYKAIKYQKQ